MGLGKRELDELLMTLSQTQQAHLAENGNARGNKRIREKDPKRHKSIEDAQAGTSNGLRRTGKNRRQVNLEKEGRTVNLAGSDLGKRGRQAKKSWRRKAGEGASSQGPSPGFARLVDDGRRALLDPQAQLPRTNGDTSQAKSVLTGLPIAPHYARTTAHPQAPSPPAAPAL